jgi:hypothetical protein
MDINFIKLYYVSKNRYGDENGFVRRERHIALQHNDKQTNWLNIPSFNPANLELCPHRSVEGAIQKLTYNNIL